MMKRQVSDLVDPDRGLLSRRVFIDHDVYQEELARVFARCWLFLAHESQVTEPGDFFSSYMGEDPVLVVRDSSGRLNAFLNSCRHRGMRVCRAEAGNAASFMCTYHGWVYGNDGRLTSVPRFKDAYFEELDLDKWGLIPVPQVDSYKGLIFATFDPHAPALIDYLGDMAWYLDMMLDRREGGTEVIGGVQKWIMPTNWKFPAENFVGDGYHIATTHLGAMRAGIGGGPSYRPQKRICIDAGNGHGLGASLVPFDQSGLPEIAAYTDTLVQAEMEQRLGPKAGQIWPIHGTVFPNMSLLWPDVERTIRVWHPRGPDKVEVWSWCLVDTAAPPEMRETLLREYVRTFGPGGGFEQDDGENWDQCTASSRGWFARQHPLNLQMGLGHEGSQERLPGITGAFPSELSQRGFYRRWAELMAGG